MSVSSSVLPATKRDDPIKRRRGIFIEPQEERETTSLQISDSPLTLIAFAYRVRTLGNERGTIPTPSLIAMIPSIGTFVSLSTWPLGHVITSESIFERFPNPKCIRGSLADI